MNIWAHRGLSGLYPENTIQAFKEACQYDITGIELDIQMTKDGSMVVIHDEKVNRTTDGKGYVKDLTLEELRSLHIKGSDTQRIPTIEEVFDTLKPYCQKNGLMIDIELKNSVVDYPDMEQRIVELVHAYQLAPYVIYSSFNVQSMGRIKEIDPDAHTAIIGQKASDCLAAAIKTAADAIHPYVKDMDLSDEIVLPIRAWSTKQEESLYPKPAQNITYQVDELKRLGITDLFTNRVDLYKKKKEDTSSHEILWFFNKCVDGYTGYLKEAEDTTCVNWEPIHVTAGTQIYITNPSVDVHLYFYDAKIPQDLIYRYTYEPESNWTTYNSYMTKKINRTRWIETEGFIRIVIRGIQQKTQKLDWHQYLSIDGPAVHKEWPYYFAKECQKTVDSVQKIRKPDDAVFFLLADSHYSIGGTWDDTARNMKMTARQLHPDGIIHLGDMTDGLTPMRITEQFVQRTMDDLQSMDTEVYCCIGNHDTNYFKNNPERMSMVQCSQLYLKQEQSWYVRDLRDKKLRLYFLDSYDPNKAERYGFPFKEVVWLWRSLKDTPEGYKILVFSHVPLLAKLHHWSKKLRNGRALLWVLEHYQKKHHSILAFIHGHNHAEQLYMERAFPIVSIGSNKLEDFKGKKPQGAWTYNRQQGTVTQDLWDVLVVKENQLSFIRYGAGGDRTIEGKDIKIENL